MKLRSCLVATLVGLSMTAPAAAGDSIERASEASIGASVFAGSVVAWATYAGSEFTVKAIRATAEGAELLLQGTSGAVETSVVVSRDVIGAASTGVGTVVRVVADSTGTALIASGTLIAYVPNEIGRSLLYHARYVGRTR